MALPLDRVDAFLADVRSIETKWFAKLMKQQRGLVIGASPWNGQSALLEKMKSQHAFSPDHMLVCSITAYFREQQHIDGERRAELKQRGWPLPINHASYSKYFKREMWFDFLHANCRARNISRLSFTGEDVRTPAELWAHITFCRLPVRSALGRGSRERPPLCPEDIERVYGAMHRLGLDAPRPPFPQFTDTEAEIELTRIANDLERADRGRYEATLAEETATANPTPPRPCNQVVQHVTLDMAAAIVQRSKKTLENRKKRKSNPLPDADVAGGGGKPSEWVWSTLRPWLEAEFSKSLPATFPDQSGIFASDRN